MDNFFLNKILYPLLAILFCLLFGVPFVYHGFQTVVVVGTKIEADQSTLDITRSHYAGLIKKKYYLEEVDYVNMETSRVRRVGKARRLVSGVFVYAGDEKIRLFAGSSNLDEGVKWEAINQINDFIKTPGLTEFIEVYKIRNLFGWFGMPFLILGVWGLLAWPFSLIKQ